MSQAGRTFRGIPRTTWRRLRNTPTYFFIVWRWVTWFYALAVIFATHTPMNIVALPLLISLIQSLIVTLYAPVLQIFLPDLPRLNLMLPGRKQRTERRPRRMLWNRNLPQPLAVDQEANVPVPIAGTQNSYWNIALYSLDVIVCGLVTYYGAVNSNPPFGDGSPFYRYGLSTVLVAAFAYGYRGSLLAALGYELIVLFGAFFPPIGPHPPYTANALDLLGSFIDAPLVAIVAAYVANLLNSYTRSRRREQDNVRKQRALLRVGKTLVESASDRQYLLQQSVEEIRKGGHFERLIIALMGSEADEESSVNPQVEIDTSIEAGVVEAAPDKSRVCIEQVAQSQAKVTSFDRLDAEEPYGIARIYVPFFKEGHVYMVLGAESIRQQPFEEKHEEFLTTVGSQLVVALENMRLTEEAAELSERGRIAREIHDGVAQLVYMLSLNTETCLALVQRIAGSSEEEAQKLSPLTERLEKLVTISKQALWETRHYMFQLRPLISGTTSLTQILSNQLREFEAISGLPTRLQVEGSEESLNGDRRHARRIAQMRVAIFRITQEALTNAYKHAGATQIQVLLHYRPHSVEVVISDNGRGMNGAAHSHELSGDDQSQHIYSGRGLQGMHERAEELGGTFEVAQATTGGVCVRACIPT